MVTGTGVALALMIRTSAFARVPAAISTGSAGTETASPRDPPTGVGAAAFALPAITATGSDIAMTSASGFGNLGTISCSSA
jgi:hypothetical protein